jgi:hypothetical protein
MFVIVSRAPWLPDLLPLRLALWALWALRLALLRLALWPLLRLGVCPLRLLPVLALGPERFRAFVAGARAPEAAPWARPLDAGDACAEALEPFEEDLDALEPFEDDRPRDPDRLDRLDDPRGVVVAMSEPPSVLYGLLSTRTASRASTCTVLPAA